MIIGCTGVQTILKIQGLLLGIRVDNMWYINIFCYQFNWQQNLYKTVR